MIRALLYCGLATAAIAVRYETPKRAIPVCALLACAGYGLYLLLNGSLTGFFMSTLVIALLGEIASRIMHMPATIFIFTGILPIVPGMGLYTTIMELVAGNMATAGELGVQTLLAMAMMAIAIAVNGLFVRGIIQPLLGLFRKGR